MESFFRKLEKENHSPKKQQSPVLLHQAILKSKVQSPRSKVLFTLDFRLRTLRNAKDELLPTFRLAPYAIVHLEEPRAVVIFHLLNTRHIVVQALS